MALNHSNSSNLEQLALKGLKKRGGKPSGPVARLFVSFLIAARTLPSWRSMKLSGIIMSLRRKGVLIDCTPTLANRACVYSGPLTSKPRSIYLYNVNNTSYVITNTGILLLERDYVTFRSLLSQIRLSSVTFARPTHGVETLGNLSSLFSTIAILWPPCKI